MQNMKWPNAAGKMAIAGALKAGVPQSLNLKKKDHL